MPYEFSDADVAEVISLVSAAQVPSDLREYNVRSDVLFGEALDYVYEKCRENIDLSKLTDAERMIAERSEDETPDDIEMFIDSVLKPPQRKQFKRAVKYRAAGIAVGMTISQEAFSGTGEPFTYGKNDWEKLRDQYWQQADDNIARLRDAFPDDAFPSKVENALAKYRTFALTNN